MCAANRERWAWSEVRRPSVNNLQREAFLTSRAMDFATENGLTTQTRHPKQDWPLVVLNELIDNGLGACEGAGVTPRIVYLAVWGNGTLPAKARQVMYEARRYILEKTGLTKLDDNNFTQKLIPEYRRLHPEKTANWD